RSGRRRAAGAPREGPTCARARTYHVARDLHRHGRELPRAAGGPWNGRARMLTVDFDRLDVRAGHRMLDLGCGGGRHVFEALRRGALVVALDQSAAELKDVRAVVAAMVDAGELATDTAGGGVNGDA